MLNNAHALNTSKITIYIFSLMLWHTIWPRLDLNDRVRLTSSGVFGGFGGVASINTVERERAGGQNGKMAHNNIHINITI